MVLYPLTDAEIPNGHSSATIPAWQAVEKKQKQPARDWWLIAQPDHAALAGDLAANLNSPLFPQLDQHVIRAIALHDAGWARFDGGERDTGHDLEIVLRDPQLDAQGRPLSFLEMTPEDFLRAWADSIIQAERAAPIGGVMVSQHFCRLAANRLQSRIDNPQDTHRLKQFLRGEAKRQEHLLEHGPRPLRPGVAVRGLRRVRGRCAGAQRVPDRHRHPASPERGHDRKRESYSPPGR